jgi:hypothetical protein
VDIKLGLFFLLLCGCASENVISGAVSAASKPTREQLLNKTRDDILGPNRALQSVEKKSAAKNKKFIYRNVATAFPDNGKNQLLKNRALAKNLVSGAVDHSPWRLRVYGNQEHEKSNQRRFSTPNKVLYSTPLSQKDSLRLSLDNKRALASEPFYQVNSQTEDDIYESNNAREQAFDLVQYENTWLSLVAEEGAQRNDDWYRIFISPQYRHLVVDLRFQSYLGDIDLKLYDAKGQLVGVSQGTGDDEYLNLNLDLGGYYYLQVYGSNLGNHYDLKYSSYFMTGGDDEYEENDTLRTAFDLRSGEGKWLSEFKGEAVAADDDYYKIQVPNSKRRVVIDLRVDIDGKIERGDVDVRLIDDKGSVIASSANTGSDDLIDFVVPHSGVYFIKVYPFQPLNNFNMYDLKWQSMLSVVSQSDSK